MWGQGAIAAALLLCGITFSAADQPAELSNVTVSVGEPAVSESSKGEDIEKGNVYTPEALLAELASAANIAIDGGAPHGGVSLELSAAHNTETGEDSTGATPGDAVASNSTASSNHVRGRKMLAFGVLLLLVGVTMSTAGRQPQAPQARVQPSSVEATVRSALEMMDKLGIKSASKVAVGCIIAGFLELIRSLNARQNSATQSGQTVQPTLKGRTVLILGVVALLASIPLAGVDFSNLNVNELLKVLYEYLSKSHFGLFLAGGAAFLKSVYDLMENQKHLLEQQQSGGELKEETGETPDSENQPETADDAADLAENCGEVSGAHPSEEGSADISPSLAAPSEEPSPPELPSQPAHEETGGETQPAAPVETTDAEDKAPEADAPPKMEDSSSPTVEETTGETQAGAPEETTAADDKAPEADAPPKMEDSSSPTVEETTGETQAGAPEETTAAEEKAPEAETPPTAEDSSSPMLEETAGETQPGTLEGTAEAVEEAPGAGTGAESTAEDASAPQEATEQPVEEQAEPDQEPASGEPADGAASPSEADNTVAAESMPDSPEAHENAQ
ncbi:hypothetical protein, conserved [Eimeria maxima]|uniref:Uncharacterized protein n=1 Tax=Eimeria maxima TaxID=5804 RepID=U6M4W3_EIMMA|nr:hypothetical protein, conserved [Eimeria maxima]CDJ59041.1 hypothetical protein, conserved [Eimeria maxima]